MPPYPAWRNSVTGADIHRALAMQRIHIQLCAQAEECARLFGDRTCWSRGQKSCEALQGLTMAQVVYLATKFPWCAGPGLCRVTTDGLAAEILQAACLNAFDLYPGQLDVCYSSKQLLLSWHLEWSTTSGFPRQTCRTLSIAGFKHQPSLLLKPFAGPQPNPRHAMGPSDFGVGAGELVVKRPFACVCRRS